MKKVGTFLIKILFIGKYRVLFFQRIEPINFKTMTVKLRCYSFKISFPIFYLKNVDNVQMQFLKNTIFKIWLNIFNIFIYIYTCR